MGVIRRQSLKHAAVNLIGLAAGALSTFLVYPHVQEQYGLIQILLQVGLIGLPVMSLGANTVAIRFFPKFQDATHGHHGFLPLLMLLCAAGFTLSLGLAWIFWEPYMHTVASKSPLIRQYLWLAFPIAFCYVLSSVLFLYSSNFKRIVVPSLLLDFSQKIVLPVLMFCVWKNWITLQTAVWCMVAHSAFVTTGLILYLRWLGEWHWKPEFSYLTRELKREMAAYIGFWSLGGFALLVAAKSDIFMVGSISAVKAAGTFTIAAALAAIIEIPIKSLYAASASSVARHLADDNMEALGKLYKGVSINLLSAGLLLFGGMWVCIEQIFSFFPASQAAEIGAGIWVFFFIGLSRLVEMATGMNNNIVYYSPHYRFALLSLGISAILTTVLNFMLIPRIGMTGAAIATLTSMILYNLFSIWLVWAKYRLFPFTGKTFRAIGFALLAFSVAHFLPDSHFALLDILIKGGVYAAIFVFLILYFRVSDDLNDLWQLGRARVRSLTGGGKFSSPKS